MSSPFSAVYMRNICGKKNIYAVLCLFILLFLQSGGIYLTNEKRNVVLQTPLLNPPWQSDWIPKADGALQCVYTNFTFEGMYDGYPLLNVWGKTVSNNCSNLLLYYQNYVFCKPCMDHYHKQFPYDQPFNCSVTRNCTTFRPFFIDTMPPPFSRDTADIMYWTLFLLLQCGLFVVTVVVFGVVLFTLYRKYQQAELLLMLPHKTNSFEKF